MGSVIISNDVTLGRFIWVLALCERNKNEKKFFTLIVVHDHTSALGIKKEEPCTYIRCRVMMIIKCHIVLLLAAFIPRGSTKKT